MRRTKSDIDKAFTDKAWSEMKTLLDLEMPVTNNRKKPLFWWWLSGALLAGFIIGGVAVWHVGSGIPHKAFFPSVNEVEGNEPGAGPVASVGRDTGQTSGHDFAEGKSKKSSPEKASVALQQRRGQNLLPPLTQPAASSDLPAGPTVQAVTNSAKADSQPHANRRPFSLPLLERSTTNSILSESGTSPGIRTFTSLAAGKIKSFYFAAQQSTTAAGVGIATGIQRQFPLGNSRWSLNIGAGYAYLQRPLYVLQIDTLNPANGLVAVRTAYSFEPLNADFTVANAAISTRRKQDLAMHYLEVPLTVSRACGSRWGLAAGLRPSFLLAAAPGLASGGLFRSTQKGMLESNLDTQGQSETPNQVPVSIFDLKLLGAVYYRFSPAWKLALSYEQGTVDVLQRNTSGEYNNMLRLGLHYNLPGK